MLRPRFDSVLLQRSSYCYRACVLAGRERDGHCQLRRHFHVRTRRADAARSLGTCARSVFLYCCTIQGVHYVLRCFSCSQLSLGLAAGTSSPISSLLIWASLALVRVIYISVARAYNSFLSCVQAAVLLMVQVLEHQLH
jgi:hypothetical protein